MGVAPPWLGHAHFSPVLLLRKEQWGQSVCQVWSVLLSQTRLESREHVALGDACCNTLTQRLVHASEDTHRLHKRVGQLTHTHTRNTHLRKWLFTHHLINISEP